MELLNTHSLSPTLCARPLHDLHRLHDSPSFWTQATSMLISILLITFLGLTPSFAENNQPEVKQTNSAPNYYLGNQQPQRSIAESPKQLVRQKPKKRGFWGTFFFWGGAVICMLFVAVRVFDEQLHERRTLKVFDQLGPFFPEFERPNLFKWIQLASPHIYHGWENKDMSGLESFSTQRFQADQRASLAQLDQDGLSVKCEHAKVLNFHPLSAQLIDGEDTPPKGIKLTLRVEVKGTYYREKNGTLLDGKKKSGQQQWCWQY